MAAQTIEDLLSLAPVAETQAAVVMMGRDSVETTTRGELVERARRLAGGLAAAGMEHGDRVVILAPNSVEWVISVLGVMGAGGVVVPLDTQMPGEDLAHVLSDCSPRFLFATAAMLERLPEEMEGVHQRLFDVEPGEDASWAELLEAEPIAPEPGGEDEAAIFYTSGTTGPPKGVPLTHRNLASNVEALCGVEGLVDHHDRVLVPLPFHHVYPFTVGILVPLALGAPLIVPFSLVGPQIVRALREGEATVMLGVPRLYEAVWTALEDRVAGRSRLAAGFFHGALGLSGFAHRRLGLRLGRRLFAPLHRRLAPRLRLVVAGGAALDPDLGRRMQALGWEVTTGYGLSETSPILTFNPLDRVRLESAGVALPGVELAIDDAGSSDGRGEVMARGPNVFSGYLNLPEKTARVLDDDGWFRTGDTGSLDADGYLYLHGRESSMIVLSGGENVDPERVEEALRGADGVREAGVLARDDRLAAVVIPEAEWLREASGDELRERVEQAVEAVSRELPSHHRPATLRVGLDPLPRTRLGKLRRHKLEELFDRLGEEDALAGARPEPVSREAMAPEDQQLLSDPAVERAWDYLAERFHDLRLTPDSSLARDLGVDSLGWVDLSLALQYRAGVDLDDSAIARVESVRDLLQEVAGASQAGEGGADLVEQLTEPEKLLDEAQQRAFDPPGPLRRALGLVLLALARLITWMWRIKVRGRFPDNGPFLIAPRHLSMIDPLVVMRGLSRRQLQSLYWAGWTGYFFSNPVARAFSRAARILPTDPARAPRSSLALAAAALQRGHTLIWFPEGQRSPDGELQALQPGIGVLLRAQPVPVIPVWIEGTREIMPPGRWLPRPGRVRVVIGEPVPPDEWVEEPDAIVEGVHAALAALGEKPEAGD